MRVPPEIKGTPKYPKMIQNDDLEKGKYQILGDTIVGHITFLQSFWIFGIENPRKSRLSPRVVANDPLADSHLDHFSRGTTYFLIHHSGNRDLQAKNVTNCEIKLYRVLCFNEAMTIESFLLCWSPWLFSCPAWPTIAVAVRGQVAAGIREMNWSKMCPRVGRGLTLWLLLFGDWWL